MATKDNNSGLLSKVARFVRNPTKDWGELDNQEPEADSGYSKQALKEMIERKRQNDFVRRREFDQLRKLRRNEPTVSSDQGGRPSFFQSSLASNPDDRAMTLKKIDEIEAQMSKQWWKGKQDEGVVAANNFPMSSNVPLTQQDSFVSSSQSPDRTSGFAPTQASELEPGSGASWHRPEDVPTQMGATAAAADQAGSGSPRIASKAPARGGRSSFGASGFPASNLSAVEMGDNLADPDLEEAAIRFANGDDAGAEAGLLDALHATQVSPESADVWAGALFDLYRATGQQASFDRVAIEYAERFGRSAPAWFSIPDQLGRKEAAAAPRPLLSPNMLVSAWECPSELDLQSVMDLRGRLLHARAPWSLDWTRLSAITPDALELLANMFAEWCATPVTLNFGGADALERTLRACTPSGDRTVDLLWWSLRLDALRIMRMQDDFELAALEYCITFEVSPPSWQDPLCGFVREEVSAAAERSDVADMEGADSPQWDTGMGQALTAPMGLDAMPATVVELTGEILGDAADALNKLQAGLLGADRLVISCARLIRVDFSAAGSILNWVAVRQAEGCQVQFREVHRLIAAFFSVIGINEHARVVLRTS
ncbi:STAS domain-containing protein [Rhodoferax sp.]|uniref:STAS domain-containing protein n=1 Tax=Rhodoferax sp. TaxID=50421 RepID=UPI00275CCB66|nr:STAS domain-containing protein [Rhodoferax sp.]